MKKVNSKLGLVLMAFAALFFASCEDQDAPLLEGLESEDVNNEVEIDGDFEDVDNFSLESMELFVYGSEADAGGGVNARVLNRRHHLPDCAEVSHDTTAQVITIDFGEGCETRGGKIISGKIIVSYTARKFIPGAIITTTFEDFYIDGKLIEGTRTVENISDSLEDNPTFHITLVGGKVTLPDGAFATREVDKTKMWVRAANPLSDEFHILEGSVVTGTDFDQVAYSILVLETLIHKNLCDGMRIKVPVAGVKEVTKGENNYVVDFGDGECDTIVVITIDGESKEVELKRRLASGS